MSDNIGGKIKGLAIVIGISSLISSSIFSVLFMATSKDLFPFGIIVLLSGILFSVLLYWLLYGLGQLIENSDVQVNELRNQTIMLKRITSENNKSRDENSTTHYCTNCGEILKDQFCTACGTKNDIS
ncbi:MAG: zinc ribbon domain-containing protein [Ruminococcaceae bacterium]|nr:zinc ribbon domain-containing protein [Oscillospiraceae bacterium]